MRIKSPLSNLREVLSQVNESATAYQALLTSSEAATRAALVDPVLRALGWDVANPNMVEVEKTVNSKRADYALRNSSSVIVAVVEAKKLNEDLNQPNYVQKLLAYAQTFGVSSVFTTNGTIWQHCTSSGSTHFKALATLDLKDGDISSIAAYLVQELDAAKFWQEQPDVDVLAQEVDQLRSDFSTLQKQVADLTKGKAPLPPPSPLLDDEWVALTDINNATRTRPSALRLPDESQPKVKYWKDVLVETCKFVLAHEKNIPVPLVDRSGLTVNLIDTDPPAKGISFISTDYNGQTVYLHTNYSAENHIANALYVCQKLTGSYSGAKPAVIYKPTTGANL